jgi:hypothetical protein
MENNNVSIGGGFFSMLAIVFITLKLLGITAVANWSWWWVLSPLWGPIAFVIAIVIFVLIIYGFISLVNAIVK